MASRKEVTAAIESQPHSATVLVSDGFKLLASRDGHGDSAVLLMLESDLLKRVKAGEPFNARPGMSPSLRKAARRQRQAVAGTRASQGSTDTQTETPDRQRYAWQP